MTVTLPEDRITAFCDAVMRGVASKVSGRVRDYDAACAIMRAEVKAALLGDGDYAVARKAVVDGALHAGYFTALVVTTCLDKMIADGIVQ